MLLVPDEDASLARRSGALFDWCRGFLGGFGLAAGADPPLSGEGREALADLARLAAATAQEDGDDEDEDALVEIEEFVRVAVLLLHGDCALGAAASPEPELNRWRVPARLSRPRMKDRRASPPPSSPAAASS